MVWLLAILSVVLFGGMGAAAGLAPAACGLIMLLVALLLSGPLTSLAAMLLPKEFINHPLAAWFPDSMFYMELVLVLFVFYIIFWGTGFWVSSKIDFWLKHVGTELQRRTWTYLNHGIGFFLGLVTATIFILIIAMGAYAPGYLVAQTTPNEDGQPWGIVYLNQFSKAMKDTGLDKIAARWDKTPSSYFEYCDILGIIVNNPPVMYRVKNYPPIYAKGDRSEVSDLLNSGEVKDLINNRSGCWDLLNNSSVLSFLSSGSCSELRQEIDFQDFIGYLKTGSSPKYDSFKILGKWEMDVDQVVLMAKKNQPDITYRQMRFLSALLRTYFNDTTLKVTIDKRIVLQKIISDVPALISTLQNPANPQIVPPELAPVTQETQQKGPQVGAGAASAQSNNRRGGVFSPSRYREALDHNAATQAMLNDTAAPVEYNDDGTVKEVKPPEIKKIDVSGSWSGDGELYKVNFAGIEMDAIIEGNIMTVSTEHVRLYFIRNYE